jgi:hypothetical protein
MHDGTLFRRVSDLLARIGVSIATFLLSVLISFPAKYSSATSSRLASVRHIQTLLTKARKNSGLRIPSVPSPLKNFVIFPCELFVAALNKVVAL